MENVSVEKVSAEISGRVVKAWAETVKAVNKLLDTHKRFGFLRFQEELNPSLADMIEAFSTIEDVLSKFVESEKLGPDEAKTALNAKQCILFMKMLLVAFENKDEARYNEIIRLLELQPKITC